MPVKPIFIGILALFCSFISCTSTHSPTTTPIVKSLNGEAPPLHYIPPATQIVKTIYVDDNFTDAERAVIRDATEEWENVSNGIIKYNLEYDYTVNLGKISHKIVIVDLSADDILTKLFDANIHGDFLAGYAKQYDMEYIFLCTERLDDPYSLKIAVERQLGKELGLSDIPQEKPAVMNPIINPKVACPSIYDVEELCRIETCNVDDLTYCKSGD